jgi:hypothetical protein
LRLPRAPLLSRSVDMICIGTDRTAFSNKQKMMHFIMFSSVYIFDDNPIGVVLYSLVLWPGHGPQNIC